MSDDSNSTESEQMGRSARRRARTRADLLVAARKVFAQHGYHEASIAEITRLADVGVGTFYLHFRDKDDAFSTLLGEGFREMQQQIATAWREGEGALLSTMVRAVFRQAYEYRDLFQIVLSARGQFTGTRTFQAQDALAEHLTRLLEMARANGWLSDEYDLPVLGRLITGMLTQGIVWWFEHEEPEPEVMAEQVLLLLQRGLPVELFHEKQIKS